MPDRTAALRSERRATVAPAPPSPLPATDIDADEASFRALAEESGDPVALVEHDTIVRFANASAASLMGLSAAEIAGKSLFESLRYEDADRAASFFQEALAHPGLPVTAEFLFRHPGGGLRALEIVALNRLDTPGMGAMVVSFNDVTERVQAQEARARLAAIVESSDDAIIGQTLEGVITSWNLSAERLYGYSSDEAVGHPISLTVPPDRMGELKDYLSRVRTGERVDHIETVRVRKDGSRLDVSITVSPIRDDSGNIIGLSKSARDITERRRFEAELWRKNIELTIASRAKDNFLASMSHELRTPLNSIIGFTGTLLMKLPGQLTGDQERQLSLIQVSARHLLSLINDLLNLAKVGSGKADLQIEPVEIHPAVEEVAATLRPGATAKGLMLEVSLPTESVEIQTDRRSLMQILMNLATNAIKFTDEGTVRMHVKRVVSVANRREVSFRVEDTGIGILPEDQKRLFGAFEQFHPERQKTDAGSGLGLHLSQRMAGLLGGRIEFESEPGRGSAFTLFLPER
jgi:protein-histidine pros-kinase